MESETILIAGKGAVSIQTLMRDSVDIGDEFRNGLEATTNKCFKTRGMVLNDSFSTLSLWDDFAYMVALVKGSSPLNPQKVEFDRVFGVLTGFLQETVNGRKFMLYDTVGIIPEYQGHEYLRTLINASRKNDRYIISQNIGVNLSAGLRTSDAKADEKYSRMSELRTVILSPNPTEIDSHAENYAVHLFGLPINPIKKNAAARDITNYISSLPPKFTTIH